MIEFGSEKAKEPQPKTVPRFQETGGRKGQKVMGTRGELQDAGCDVDQKVVSKKWWSGNREEKDEKEANDAKETGWC